MTIPQDVAVATQQPPAAGVVTGEAGAATRSTAWRIGAGVRVALGGIPPPLIAVQTTIGL